MRDARVMAYIQFDLRKQARQQSQGQSAENERMSRQVKEKPFNHRFVRRPLEQQRFEAFCFKPFENRKKHFRLHTFVPAAAPRMDECHGPFSRCDASKMRPRFSLQRFW